MQDLDFWQRCLDDVKPVKRRGIPFSKADIVGPFFWEVTLDFNLAKWAWFEA